MNAIQTIKKIKEEYYKQKEKYTRGLPCELLLYTTNQQFIKDFKNKAVKQNGRWILNDAQLYKTKKRGVYELNIESITKMTSSTVDEIALNDAIRSLNLDGFYTDIVLY